MGINPFDFVGKAIGLVDGLFQDKDEKAAYELELGKMLQQRDSEMETTLRKGMEAKERVMIATLAQGDLYTKRARPTVVYGGLVVMAVNYMILPWIAHFIGQAPPTIEIPATFWGGWAGIVATFSIGRDVNRQKAGETFAKT